MFGWLKALNNDFGEKFRSGRGFWSLTIWHIIQQFAIEVKISASKSACIHSYISWIPGGCHSIPLDREIVPRKPNDRPSQSQENNYFLDNLLWIRKLLWFQRSTASKTSTIDLALMHTYYLFVWITLIFLTLSTTKNRANSLQHIHRQSLSLGKIDHRIPKSFTVSIMTSTVIILPSQVLFQRQTSITILGSRTSSTYFIAFGQSDLLSIRLWCCWSP